VTAGKSPSLYPDCKGKCTPTIISVEGMEKSSSCIAVFSNHSDAASAIEKLAATGMERKSISLVSKDIQEGQIGTDGLASLDEDLKNIGVQEGNVHCYKCMIHGGSFLVVVSGDYTQVERACNHFERHEEQPEISIHFNAV
jgi:hypothetical protein